MGFLKKGKKSIDKKQSAQIKELQKFVFKTIENKQVNYNNTGGTNISSAGYVGAQFLSLGSGAEDGGALGSSARIGNSITLMKQEVRCYMSQSATDTYNRIRMIICESSEGNQALALSDILLYSNYTTEGDIVFASPYTTKTSTNKRYKIHMDKTFELNSLASGASRVVKYTIKYREDKSPGKLVTYDGADAVQANNHRLHVMWISDSDAISHPIAHYSVRSTFKDA
jgi:hypothetical protein